MSSITSTYHTSPSSLDEITSNYKYSSNYLLQYTFQYILFYGKRATILSTEMEISTIIECYSKESLKETILKEDLMQFDKEINLDYFKKDNTIAKLVKELILDTSKKFINKTYLGRRNEIIKIESLQLTRVGNISRIKD